MGSILKLIVVLAIGWALYSYSQQQKLPQTAQSRYKDPELTFETDDQDERAISTDDCARHINPELLQSCIESKLNKAAKKHSP